MEEKKKDLALIQGNPDLVKDFVDKVRDNFNIYLFENGIKFYDWAKKGGKVDAIVSAGAVYTPSGLPLLRQLKAEKICKKVPFILLINNPERELIKKLIQEGVSEIFPRRIKKDDFMYRVDWLISNPVSEEGKQEDEQDAYKMPLMKRTFDIIIALSALLILSPLMLLVALLIKLESRGPVFYISKRVGTGYQIFDFYKFRSMKVGADAQLKNIAHLNQYKQQKGQMETADKVDEKKENLVKEALKASADKEADLNLASYLKQQLNTTLEKEFRGEGLCQDCAIAGTGCNSMLYLDGEALCEKIYLQQKKVKDEGKFIKISNDPRVTRIGKFIRNTSIDELPQLINVLKGDMSIVGNRPLPLYEAEKITTDAFNLRFMAPAGITGLWQVTKRGTSEMSEEERMKLDNEYAKNFSFWEDIKIILRTIPALVQKENV